MTLYKSYIESLESDLHEVAANLWIGSLEAARATHNLKKLNISHVLTVANNPVEVEHQREIKKYKYLHLKDFPAAKVLCLVDEAVEFIDSGLHAGTGVLVHCLVGMSRSASIVIAYLMMKNKQTYQETLDQVKQKRAVRPNMGFARQLELIEQMNYTIDHDSTLYKTYEQQEEFDFLKKSPARQTIKEETIYKCKKCRIQVFTDKDVTPHVINGSQFTVLHQGKQSDKKEEDSTDEDKEKICKDQLFVEPLDWFKDLLTEMSGKLMCPSEKCGSKLGSFDWCGSKCTCGSWVSPAIHIQTSKVDKFVKKTEA